ncbi:hypothetical protein ABIC45_002890 [Mucilaginibacter rubeus]|uniref:hypothetical protein n=1 Tax=Mucilaginibacter rubeus TaxID=2027860 RepID=UPI00339A59E5
MVANAATYENQLQSFELNENAADFTPTFDKTNPTGFPVVKHLRYQNGYPVLQALSVPYKIRSKL